jgi:hypothetical protein
VSRASAKICVVETILNIRNLPSSGRRKNPIFIAFAISFRFTKVFELISGTSGTKK